MAGVPPGVGVAKLGAGHGLREVGPEAAGRPPRPAVGTRGFGISLLDWLKLLFLDNFSGI